MAPFQDEALQDLFSCTICCDYFFEPVTNSCCGKSFCTKCLRRWIKSSVRSAGIPRCPAGCNAKVPFKLPAPSAALTKAMEKLVPEEFERRKKEELEEDEDEAEENECHGGFVCWEAVAAAQDISFGHVFGVLRGTPGIVVGNSGDGHHLTVKFDVREDGSDLCVDLLPSHLMKPLPGNFRLGQQVMAVTDLHVNGTAVVTIGGVGTILGPAPVADHLHVLFENRSDGIQGHIALHYNMILPARLLVGGYKLGQQILCNRGLVINDQVIVPKDTPGKVIAEYSDTRLTVAFDVGEMNQRQEGYDSQCVFNLLPVEIRVFRDTSSYVYVGDGVRARNDLGINPGNVLVLAGTRGCVQHYIDEARIIVAFEGNPEAGKNPQLLTVSESSIYRTVETLRDFAGCVGRATSSELEATLGGLRSENIERLARICQEVVNEQGKSTANTGLSH